MVIDFIFVTRWEKEKSKYTMVTKTIPSKPKPEAKPKPKKKSAKKAHSRLKNIGKGKK